MNTDKKFLKQRQLDYKEGDMGPMYGYQWRHYGENYQGCDYDYKSKGIDQLQQLVDGITKNPNSRRHILSTFDPSNVEQGVLYPCHSIVLQFFVENDKYLHLKMYQRSADMFLGVPFNIASTTLLLYIVAKLTNLKPKRVIITFGDVHIYEEHIDKVKQLLQRDIHDSPQVSVPDFKTLNDVEQSVYKDFKLINYTSEGPLRAQMKA